MTLETLPAVAERIFRKVEADAALVDHIARLEHAQWVQWSQALAQDEDLSADRLARWKTMWVPYDDLPDDVKEQDRVWARKVMELLPVSNGADLSKLTNTEIFKVIRDIDALEQPELRKYDPDQPRDDNGQWTAVGGSSGSYTEGKVDEHYHTDPLNGPQTNVAEKQWGESVAKDPNLRGALFLYTGGGFRSMNATLRGRPNADKYPWPGSGKFPSKTPDINLTMSVPEAVDHMDRIIASAPPLEHDTIAYRYVGPTGTEKMFAGGVGGSFTDKGFPSVSLNRPFIEEAVRLSPHELTGVEIRIPKGTRAAYPLAANEGFPTERELILPRGATFKTISHEGKWAVVELQPPTVAKYDDSQPRDDHGRWTDAGGAGGGGDTYGGAHVHGARELSGSLGIPRSNMPQIRALHFDEFFRYAEGKGATFQHAKLPASSLRPAQNEYNPAQVAQMPDTALTKPVMISSDNYVLDGTNRWLKVLQTDPHQRVPVIRIDMPALDAIALMHSFPKSERKTVADVGASKPLEKYSPDQPRDDNGRWTGWGDMGLFYNPSHDEMAASHKNWSRTLTPPQRAALNAYKVDRTSRTNRALRHGGDLMDSATKDAVKNIDTAILKAPPLDKDTILYRHLSPEFAKSLKRGSVFTDKGFTSASLDGAFIRNFAQIHGRAVAELRVPQGTRAAYMETPELTSSSKILPEERELLMPRNGTFYVESAGDHIVMNYAPPGKQVVRKYSPDQLRDEAGRWTDEGGASIGMGRSVLPHIPVERIFPGTPLTPQFHAAFARAVDRVASERLVRLGKDGKPVPGPDGEPWSASKIETEIQKAQKLVGEAPQTWDKYEQGRKAEPGTPERAYFEKRAALNGRLIAENLGVPKPPDPGQPKDVWWVIGPSGAGKNTVFADQVAPSYQRGLTPIDPDENRQQHDGRYGGEDDYRNGLGASGLSDEADKMAAKVMRLAVKRGDNVAVFGTGKTFSRTNGKGLLENMRAFKAAGYRNHVLLVHATPEFAMRSAIRRFVQTGRYVSPTFTFGTVDSGPTRNYVKLLTQHRDLIASARAIDNTDYARREFHPENDPQWQ